MKRGEQPRRLMTKVRRKFHRPTRAHIPKSVYDRNEAKRELQEIIDDECICQGMECECGYEDQLEEAYENVRLSEEG